jgi:hypothetical protein
MHDAMTIFRVVHAAFGVRREFRVGSAEALRIAARRMPPKLSSVDTCGVVR